MYIHRHTDSWGYTLNVMTTTSACTISASACTVYNSDCPPPLGTTQVTSSLEGPRPVAPQCEKEVQVTSSGEATDDNGSQTDPGEWVDSP